MILLASRSKARRKLIKKCKPNAVFGVSEIDETRLDGESVEDYVFRLSYLKALMLYKKGLTVIGADTVIVLDGEVFGKPKDRNEAFWMLKSLSGKLHECFSGVSVISDSYSVSFFERALIKVDRLSDTDIEMYLETGEYKGRAAGYAIQGRASSFMRVIEGDKTTVIGLPMKRLCRVLKSSV
ncbi:Maf family protein [Hippea maritima]|uniref:Nucleoside triphosphate pyrophosphatase n=1 Tax=Hippea maritima (strain ATCC 700847 / DSM 10411 / MH2) TaxID=760142 RepID=F2LVG2_HIPMA|nr:Maf family protein [Hippea maritima]AEA33746.1 Septum formation protein Maf [Hippea maritima DSM 10411]